MAETLETPWEAVVSELDGETRVWVCCNERRHILCSVNYNGFPDRSVEIASLFAAAPELLEACRAILYFWERDPYAFGDEATVTSLAGRMGHLMDKVRPAVEKAEGNTDAL